MRTPWARRTFRSARLRRDARTGVFAVIGVALGVAVFLAIDGLGAWPL